MLLSMVSLHPCKWVQATIAPQNLNVPHTMKSSLKEIALRYISLHFPSTVFEMKKCTSSNVWWWRLRVQIRIMSYSLWWKYGGAIFRCQTESLGPMFRLAKFNIFQNMCWCSHLCCIRVHCFVTWISSCTISCFECYLLWWISSVVKANWSIRPSLRF